jgi:hypothetical protein
MDQTVIKSTIKNNMGLFQGPVFFSTSENIRVMNNTVRKR